MLAPYRIINRHSSTRNLKLVPRNDIKKMKGKHITEALKNFKHLYFRRFIHI